MQPHEEVQEQPLSELLLFDTTRYSTVTGTQLVVVIVPSFAIEVWQPPLNVPLLQHIDNPPYLRDDSRNTEYVIEERLVIKK